MLHGWLGSFGLAVGSACRAWRQKWRRGRVVAVEDEVLVALQGAQDEAQELPEGVEALPHECGLSWLSKGCASRLPVAAAHGSVALAQRG